MRNAGGSATRSRVRAVREAVEAAEAFDRAGVGEPAGGFAPAEGAGAGPAAGGAAGAGQVAAAGMAKAQQGPLATFASMLTSYGTYNALPDDEKRSYLQARASFNHPQTEQLKDGPGDITVMAKAMQAALKVATTITTSRSYGTNEDIGEAFLFSAFEGDALALARSALSDTPPSDGATFRLHGTLIALLRAYLPTRAAKL